MNGLASDLRYAFRAVFKHPRFSLVAVAALALAACYLPARRAMRLDPVSALKQD